MSTYQGLTGDITQVLDAHYGGGGVGQVQETVQAASFNASLGEYFPIDATASVTMVLPASGLYPGAWVSAQVVAGPSTSGMLTNPVTINGNGHVFKAAGGTSTVTLQQVSQGMIFTFTGSVWRVQDSISLTQEILRSNGTYAQLTTTGAVLPTYAGTRTRRWDPMRSLYGMTPAIRAVLRAKLGNGLSGGTCKIVFAGDSHLASYNITSPWLFGIAGVVRSKLASAGFPISGTGKVYCCGWNSNGPDSRWTFSGGFAAVSFEHHAQASAIGAVATYTPGTGDATGTQVVLTYLNATGVAFSLTVDGGTPANGNVSVTAGTYSGGVVTSASGNTLVPVTVTVTGLANTTHTVVVTTTTASQCNVECVEVCVATGITITNAAISGTKTSHWLATATGAGAYNPDNTVAFYSPDIVFFDLLTNDAFNNAIPLATFATNTAAIIATWQGRGTMFMGVIPPEPNPTIDSTANWSAYVSAVYDAADAASCLVWDWADYEAGGSYAAANALGIVQVDGIHRTAAGAALAGVGLESILALGS